jgi:GR25 family glycosyltransferase involved in LPS biosynthesis
MTSLLEEKLGIKIHDTLCISIKGEEKRQSDTLSECKKVGITSKFYLTDRHPTSGVQGCLESHIYCIEYAKKHNLENVLIIEDDVQFDLDAINALNPLDFPKDFDMLYLGYHVNRGYRYSENVIKLTSAFTTHAYIINKKMYDVVLDNISSDWAIIPEFSDLNTYEKPYFANNKRAIDVFYSKWIHHHGGNSYGIFPMMAYQRPEFSSIENQHVDYSSLFKTKANLFYNHHYGKLRGEYTWGDSESQQELIDRVSSQSFSEYDYVFIKSSGIDTSEYTHEDYGLCNRLSSDILCMTNTMKSPAAYYMRMTYFTKKSGDKKIEYMFPPIFGPSTLIEYHKNVKITKPIVCFYYNNYSTHDNFKKITGMTDKQLQDYTVYICTNDYHESIDDIKFIKHKEYQYLPTHTLILMNDITFFLDQPTNCSKIILFMTQDKFIDTWNGLSVPLEGNSLFHNMLFHISHIICSNKEILNNFISTYGIMNNARSTFIIKDSATKKINNSFICVDTSENIEFFNDINKEIPNAKLFTIKHTDVLIDFSEYEMFICFEPRNDSLTKQALSTGTICIGNHDMCSINTTRNNINDIVKFLRNPNEKEQLINNIYANNKEYYTYLNDLVSS